MKHFTPITVLKAQQEGEPTIVAILDRIFGFVLDLVDVKQKSQVWSFFQRLPF